VKLGFVHSPAPASARQPIFAEQASRRVGYVQHEHQEIWFCDADGKKIARVLRYKPCQAPVPSCNAVGSYFPHLGRD
jgi:hypothetical protein